MIASRPSRWAALGTASELLLMPSSCSPPTPWLVNAQMVARCKADILAARGVKPTLSPNLNTLATVEALGVKRLLFIGVGCQACCPKPPGDVLAPVSCEDTFLAPFVLLLAGQPVHLPAMSRSRLS